MHQYQYVSILIEWSLGFAALVQGLDEERVLNGEGLRFADEFARHKVLDLVGDLALLGLPLIGHVKAARSGHALHQALVAEIRANPSCWTVEVPQSSDPLPVPTRVRVPAYAR